MKKLKKLLYTIMNLLPGYFPSKELALQPVKIKDNRRG